MTTTDCNCPMCTKTTMEIGKVYRCKKGGIMGCDDGSPGMPFAVLNKVLSEDFANEQADRDIDNQITEALK